MTRKLKIHVFQSEADGQFYFHVKSANGEKIAHGEGYVREQDCLGVVELLQTNLGQADLILETKS